jgi:hypothetical protein
VRNSGILEIEREQMDAMVAAIYGLSAEEQELVRDSVARLGLGSREKAA